jgi:hypothetical protein
MTLCNLCTKLDFSRLAYRKKREIGYISTSAIDQNVNGRAGLKERDVIHEDYGESDQSEGSTDERGDTKFNHVRIPDESNQDFGDEYNSIDSRAAEGEYNFGGHYRYDLLSFL